MLQNSDKMKFYYLPVVVFSSIQKLGNHKQRFAWGFFNFGSVSVGGKPLSEYRQS